MLNTIGLLRTASKMNTPIDKVFGGVKVNTVICRECQTVSNKYQLLTYSYVMGSYTYFMMITAMYIHTRQCMYICNTVYLLLFKYIA